MSFVSCQSCQLPNLSDVGFKVVHLLFLFGSEIRSVEEFSDFTSKSVEKWIKQTAFFH